MRGLVLHTRIFLAAVIICAAGLTAMLAFRPANWIPFAILILAAELLSAVLFVNLRKKLKDIKGIVESMVIHIQPAVICAKSGEEKERAEKLHESTAIYVSYFGILLGSKVIKFNRDGIKLKAVEIGRDYISFDYSAKNEELRNIRLLYFKPDDKDELAGIIEKFRCNTGIVPAIV